MTPLAGFEFRFLNRIHLKQPIKLALFAPVAIEMVTLHIAADSVSNYRKPPPRQLDNLTGRFLASKQLSRAIYRRRQL
jgi:hypothetical protein